jgi:hypothetical protein
LLYEQRWNSVSAYWVYSIRRQQHSSSGLFDKVSSIVPAPTGTLLHIIAHQNPVELMPVHERNEALSVRATG